MQIDNFSDLTQFVYDEYLKITENFGVQKASESMINFTEKALKRYVKLYDKPLYKSAKRELQIKEAIETMPHSWWWKFWHYDLWQKVKLRLGLNEKADENQQPEAIEEEPAIRVPAEIMKTHCLPQISNVDEQSLAVKE